jgi:osmotically-inducible protein OsmY
MIKYSRRKLLMGARVRKLMIQAVLSAGLLSTLTACPFIIIGAAGGGAMAVADRRTLGAQTEDKEIAVRANSRITDALPDSAHVHVSSFNRRVLLTGEVPDDASKQRAAEVARQLSNVEGVVNELMVGNSSSYSARTNDTYLEGRVKAALIGEKDLSAFFFRVVVERGNVYLMGLVTRDEGDRGAAAAATVPGVVQVVKVFQYILPPDGSSATAAPATAPTVSNGPAMQDQGATVGAVPDSSVSSKPLEQQPPAPINNSTVIPGAAKPLQ